MLPVTMDMNQNSTLAGQVVELSSSSSSSSRDAFTVYCSLFPQDQTIIRIAKTKTKFKRIEKVLYFEHAFI